MIRKNLYIKGLILTAAMLLLASCSQQPEKIHYGSDECEFCKMMITDNRFAAQLVTDKGKVYKFDAIECLADYINEQPGKAEGAKFWVSNFANPGEWVGVDQAHFVKSEEIQSPMGESLLAFCTVEQRRNHLSEFNGKPITWEEIKTL
ncbi:MAG: nitrous oxide reductase accessory protein NosL [Balneolaceae bacterium]|nr:nitrous oxide reductase accessory protein NosL [Balneolaceae bacterium]